MKKIIAIFLSLNLLIVPAFAEYDFSDEAQAEFDRQKELRFSPTDFTRKRNAKELYDDRTNYTPDIDTPKQDLLIDVPPQPQQRPLYGSVVKVPAGTSFAVTFDSGISSGSLEKNDRLTVRLTNDLKYQGVMIAPAGSLVYGTAYDAKNAGYAYGSGMIELNFNEILTPDGTMLEISTENIYLKSESERAQKLTRDVVLGALGSLLLGAAFTAMGGGGDWGRNMLIYGGVGALGGGLYGSMNRGQEIEIPDGTTMQVKLIDTLTASPYEM